MAESILLSFHWMHQQLARRLTSDLRAAGFSVRHELDQGENEPPLNETAFDFVVALLSQAYEDSMAERLALTQATENGARVVFLLVEKMYSPGDWLKVMVVRTPMFQLVNEEEYAGCMSLLVTELTTSQNRKLESMTTFEQLSVQAEGMWDELEDDNFILTPLTKGNDFLYLYVHCDFVEQELNKEILTGRGDQVAKRTVLSRVFRDFCIFDDEDMSVNLCGLFEGPPGYTFMCLQGDTAVIDTIIEHSATIFEPEVARSIGTLMTYDEFRDLMFCAEKPKATLRTRDRIGCVHEVVLSCLYGRAIKSQPIRVNAASSDDVWSLAKRWLNIGVEEEDPLILVWDARAGIFRKVVNSLDDFWGVAEARRGHSDELSVVLHLLIEPHPVVRHTPLESSVLRPAGPLMWYLLTSLQDYVGFNVACCTSSFEDGLTIVGEHDELVRISKTCEDGVLQELLEVELSVTPVDRRIGTGPLRATPVQGVPADDLDTFARALVTASGGARVDEYMGGAAFQARALSEGAMGVPSGRKSSAPELSHLVQANRRVSMICGMVNLDNAAVAETDAVLVDDDGSSDGLPLNEAGAPSAAPPPSIREDPGSTIDPASWDPNALPTAAGAGSVSPHPSGTAAATSTSRSGDPASTLSPASGTRDGALSPHVQRSSSAAGGHKRSKSDASVNVTADVDTSRDVVSAMAPMTGAGSDPSPAPPSTVAVATGKSKGNGGAGGAGKKSKASSAQSQSSIRMTAFEMSRRLRNKIKAIESNLGYVRPAVNRKTTFSWRSREIRRHFILHGVGAGRPKQGLVGDGDVPRRRKSQNLPAAAGDLASGPSKASASDRAQGGQLGNLSRQNSLGGAGTAMVVDATGGSSSAAVTAEEAALRTAGADRGVGDGRLARGSPDVDGGNMALGAENITLNNEAYRKRREGNRAHLTQLVKMLRSARNYHDSTGASSAPTSPRLPPRLHSRGGSSNSIGRSSRGAADGGDAGSPDLLARGVAPTGSESRNITLRGLGGGGETAGSSTDVAVEHDTVCWQVDAATVAESALRSATELFKSDEGTALEPPVMHRSNGDDGVPVHWRSVQFSDRLNVLTRTLFTRLDVGDSDCVPVMAVQKSLSQSALPLDDKEISILFAGVKTKEPGFMSYEEFHQMVVFGLFGHNHDHFVHLDDERALRASTDV
eukprot:m.1172133 g.1172133  ORF g.1172133 m.1172133 type:complete len:1175 (+) comp24515_c0_seq4:311-3835(+)